MTTKKAHRPNWDQYFIAMAKIAGTRSSCDRLRAGAILVKDNRIIATGYNGAPQGLPNCDEVGHMMEEGHCVRTIHAEHNAILQAAKLSGTSTDGSTLYVKYLPCIHCSKYIVASGIKRVVYVADYRASIATEYLRSAGLDVDQYEENDDWNDSVIDLFSKDIEVMHPKEGNVKIEGE
jgi:dCMP deaminase